MEQLRERFLKIYANIPLSLRDDIILVLEKKGPISWNVAYIEIKEKSGYAQAILQGLEELKLI